MTERKPMIAILTGAGISTDSGIPDFHGRTSRSCHRSVGSWDHSISRKWSQMTEIERLQQMIEELRGLRNKCEPKNNQNPRYLRYSNAISAMLWIIDDLSREHAMLPPT